MNGRLEIACGLEIECGIGPDLKVAGATLCTVRCFLTNGGPPPWGLRVGMSPQRRSAAWHAVGACGTAAGAVCAWGVKSLGARGARGWEEPLSRLAQRWALLWCGAPGTARSARWGMWDTRGHAVWLNCGCEGSSVVRSAGKLGAVMSTAAESGLLC